MNGSNDTLTLALGTPEHRGRVRGIGVEVTHTSYFHTPTPYTRPHQSVNQQELDDLQKQWEKKFQAQAQEFQAMMAKMKADYQNAASGQASNALLPTPSSYHSPIHHAPPPPIQRQPSPPQHAPLPSMQPHPCIVPQPVQVN